MTSTVRTGWQSTLVPNGSPFRLVPVIRFVVLLVSLLPVAIRWAFMERIGELFDTLIFTCLRFAIIFNFFFISGDGVRRKITWDLLAAFVVAALLVPSLVTIPKNQMDVIYSWSSLIASGLALFVVFFDVAWLSRELWEVGFLKSLYKSLQRLEAAPRSSSMVAVLSLSLTYLSLEDVLNPGKSQLLKQNIMVLVNIVVACIVIWRNKIEKEKSLRNVVQNEMTPSTTSFLISPVVSSKRFIISISGTCESRVVNELHDTATVSGVSSEATEVDEKEKISHELDSNAPVNLASDREGYVDDCILYCSLFPADYEFTRDILVWSWIAARVINPEKNDEVEEIAGWCFDKLVMRKCIVQSGYDRLSDQMRYTLGNDDSGFFRKRNLGLQYMKGLDSDKELDDLVHLSLICEGIDQRQFEILKKCRNLKTLLLHKCNLSRIEGLLNDLFLELEFLTILDISYTNIVELPSSIEKLRVLLYLDMTHTSIKRLPESIDSLCKLETLVLLGCTSLCGLPRGMSKLINLQHLVLEFALYLQSMPIRIGQLTNLRTMKAFPIGRKNGYSIEELRNMNKLTGSLCIVKLENISNKEEAGKARLCDKQYLRKLEFMWSGLQEASISIEEEILEHLQPHFSLQELKIVFYGGGVLPSWITDPSFTQITSITLSWCKYCWHLPSFGELPSLRCLTIIEMDRVVKIDSFFCREQANRNNHAFPMLKKLSFEGMSNLETWTGVEYGDFPLLMQLVIKYCPNLVSLPSLLSIRSLKHLDISYCPKLLLPQAGFQDSNVS